MSLTSRQQLLKAIYKNEGAARCRFMSSLPFVSIEGAPKEYETLDMEGKRISVNKVMQESLWASFLIGIYDDTFVAMHNDQLCFFGIGQNTYYKIQVLDKDALGRGVMYPHSPDAVLMFKNKPEETNHKSLMLGNILAWLTMFFTDIKQSDMYSVEVSEPAAHKLIKNKAKTKSKKPWLMPEKRIIFMKPGERRIYTPGQTINRALTDRTQATHHRRGHYKTLRHERFKKNDDGTPRRVWTKAAWVGPREWIENGTEYRIIE